VTMANTHNASTLNEERNYWRSLNQKLLGDLFHLRPGSLVSLPSQTSIKQALKLLYDNDFSSAPVMREKEIIGIIDGLDIAAYVAEHHSEGEKVLDTPVSVVMDDSKKDPLFPLYVGSPAESLFKILATGIHRCPIVDGAGDMTAMISQLDALDFLSHHLSRISSVSNNTLESLGLLKKVHAVKETDNVIDCIQLLSKTKVSALAVLTAEGEVIGAFSSHDVKYLAIQPYDHLYGPLSKFINTAVGWPVALSPSSTLTEAIQKLQTDMVHRLWIIGDDNEPKGVVALTDILKIIVDCFYPKLQSQDDGELET